MTISSADCGEASASAPQRHQSIVVLTGGASAPRVLLSALVKRDLEPVLVSQPPQAMEVLADRQALAMVVIDPSGQPQLEELVHAIRQYYPGTACWQFLPSVNGKARLSQLKLNGNSSELGKLQVDAKQSVPESGRKVKPVSSSFKPRTKIAGAVPVQPVKLIDGGKSRYDKSRQQDEQLRLLMSKLRAQSPVRYGLISEEELAMLLESEEVEDRDVTVE